MFVRRFLKICSTMTLAVGLLMADDASKLSDLSLDELQTVQVTSVARKLQRLSEAPAAVYVITREDIRRSGATCVPELLRLAPGLQVARIDGTEWAISARGFNGRWSSKLLVLVDGRTVYSPMFSGVYWDAQDILPEDIDRIEVIRGPGATMWGANAVNGVINIVTRPALDTQGGLLAVSGGNADRANMSFRYGGRIGSRGYYRASSRYFDRREGYEAPGSQNSWRGNRGALRLDWRTTRNEFMVQAEDFRSAIHDRFHPVATAISPNPESIDVDSRPAETMFMGRWRRNWSENSDTSLQVYYSGTRRDDVENREDRHTLDFDFQHRLGLGSRNDLVWGADLRRSTDQYLNRQTVVFDPDRRTDILASAFVQDEIAIVQNRFHVVAGSKVERSGYMTSAQVEPGVQLIWMLNPDHTIWGSVSRAIRAPSRANSDIRVSADAAPVGFGAWITPTLYGSPDFKPESLSAYESGYKGRFKSLSGDAALFYTNYDRLMTAEPGTPYPAAMALAGPALGSDAVFYPGPPSQPVQLILPIRLSNLAYGESYGAEFTGNWDATSSLRMSGTYSWLRLQLHSMPGSADARVGVAEGESPSHQGRITSYWNVTKKLNLDSTLFLVGRLPSQGVAGYGSVHVRLGWNFSNKLEASVTADNLLDHVHREFASFVDRSGRDVGSFGRSANVRLLWKF